MAKSGMTQERSFEEISADLSKVKFVLWTAKTGADGPWEFKAGVDPKELLKRHFDPSQPTKFIAHGWTASWRFCIPFVEGNFSCHLFTLTRNSSITSLKSRVLKLTFLT